MEDRETITPINPLRTVLDEMGRPDLNVGRLGEGLFDLSVALIPTLAAHINRERSSWRRETGGGKINTGLVGQVEVYQQAFLALASLGRPGGQRGFQFYLPDGGISRLVFAVDDNGQLLVEATYYL